jgi:hypothetical protein
MPLKASDFPVPIGMRVSHEQAQKIDAMATKLGLQRNSLLRLLVQCARLDSAPAIHVDVETTRRVEGAGVSDVSGN